MSASLLVTILTLAILVPTIHGLRCKCTQSSNKAPCQDGVCDVNRGACLMLEHPTSGRLYACSSSPLPDGECDSKTTKSGVSVKYCSCNGKDFCNYEKWSDRENFDYELDNENHGQNGGLTQSLSLLPLAVLLLVHTGLLGVCF